jgi:hypothetical protein
MRVARDFQVRIAPHRQSASCSAPTEDVVAALTTVFEQYDGRAGPSPRLMENTILLILEVLPKGQSRRAASVCPTACRSMRDAAFPALTTTKIKRDA